MLKRRDLTPFDDTAHVVFWTGPTSPSVEFKELLENEKSNFRLVNSAVAFLGGVPAMINPADMSNTIPNEKVRQLLQLLNTGFTGHYSQRIQLQMHRFI